MSSVQRQATAWKEIFTNHVLDMGIISKRYVGHLLREFNNKKMIKINIEICTKSLPDISPQKTWQLPPDTWKRKTAIIVNH